MSIVLQGGETEIQMFTVYKAYLCLEPVVTPINRSKPGSLDPQSAWAIACKN
jgi:hypothetical protein